MAVETAVRTAVVEFVEKVLEMAGMRAMEWVDAKVAEMERKMVNLKA
jgi:hypothetical protein